MRLQVTAAGEVLVGELPSDAEVLAGSWRNVTEIWLRLPPHPHLLRAHAVDPDGTLWRAYAAIATVDRGQVETTMRYGAQLCDAIDHVAGVVPLRDLGWVARPNAHVDRGGFVRLGFLPASSRAPGAEAYLPPELLARWPRADERALVFLIGAQLWRWWSGRELDAARARAHLHDASPLQRLMRRCLAVDPAERPSLAECRSVLVEHAGPAPPAASRGAYEVAERAAGLLEAGRAGSALELSEAALAMVPTPPFTIEIHRRIVTAQGRAPEPAGVVGDDRGPRPAPRVERGRALSYDDEWRVPSAVEPAPDFPPLALPRPAPPEPIESPGAAATREFVVRSQLERGASALRRSFGPEEKPAAPPDAEIVHADSLRRERRLEESLAAYDAILARDPGRVDALDGRAWTLAELGRNAEAAEAFERFLAATSARAHVRVLAARAWLAYWRKPKR